MFDQVVHRVLKGAGLKLFLVVDHDHGILVVVVMLEAGHANDSLSVCLMLPNRGGDFGVFLQPQRLGSAADLEAHRAGKRVRCSPWLCIRRVRCLVIIPLRVNKGLHFPCNELIRFPP